MEMEPASKSIRKDNFSLFSLISGVLAAGLCWMGMVSTLWFFSMISVACGIAAIILYSISFKRAGTSQRIAIVGLVCGIIGLIIGLVFSIFWIFLLATTGSIYTQFKSIF